jgi:RNA polymerase sigma-70 factor (ECF subfamily)
MGHARRVVTHKNALLGAPLGAGDLEDVVQDALVAIWRKLGEYRGDGTLEAWIYRFSLLELLARLRDRRRFPRLVDDVGAEAGADSAAALLAREESRERLYRLLERVERPQGEVLRMKHLEGLEFEEIAARLGLPRNTVKTRYYRGLRRLRALIFDPRNAQEERP